MAFAPGTRLGVFEIISPIGAGGMGEVYRATDTTLKRDVALKVLPPEVATDAERLTRFQREAELLAALNHPHIAQIYAVAPGDGTFALVMELVDGSTLADRIAAGPIPIEEALRIATQIAAALDAAHERGVVHRDLKPANIKVRSDGTVKVLDFGLAKAMEPVEASTASPTISPTMSRHATMTGVILGTAAYMSPEQASGQFVDKRADIWAFGVVLWEMLTGRSLIEGETISHVLANVLTKEPDLSPVPARVRPLLTRCLQKDPKNRLRDIGDAMSLVPARDIVLHDKASSRRWIGAAGWAVAILMAAALAAAVWWKPATAVDPTAPVVRFQIERQSIDVYNFAARSFAISPDGKLLAHYEADKDGQQALLVRTLAAGESRQIPGSGVVAPVVPFWSADSRHLVYQGLTAVHVLDVSAGTTRQLCACRFRGGGSWNPDGVILLGSINEGGGLRRVSLTDRTPVAVTSASERDVSPVFLPDGRRFLFTRMSAGGATATYVGTLDGEAPRRIADGSRSLFVAALDGRGPYVLGVDEAGLVAQPIDLSTATLVGDAQIVVAGAGAASVSQNGILVTSNRAERPTVLPTWFDRKGTSIGSLGERGAIQSLDLTADGQTLAFTDFHGTEQSEIWLRNLANGAVRRLTFSREADSTPAWSPEGTRLVVSSRRDGVVNLYERAADGTGSETRVTAADDHTYANDWSHDGRWLIYTLVKRENNTDLDLWVVPMSGSADRKATPYLASPAREAQAQFSPDGRFVAYISNESGRSEVYVQPFPNAAEGKWMVSNGGGVEPRWSRDGQELFYFSGQSLMAAPITLRPTFSSGSPVRLFDAPIQAGYANDSHRWQVAPDAKRFLLLPAAGKEQAPPIDVVVNWPALLPKR